MVPSMITNLTDDLKLKLVTSLSTTIRILRFREQCDTITDEELLHLEACETLLYKIEQNS